jgi:hypothetical protein
MTDVVWSVNILLGIGLLGTIWCIYKILIWDNEEENASGSHTHSSHHDDGMMLQNRRPQPKRQPAEVFRFIRRPAKKGRKLFN